MYCEEERKFFSLTTAHLKRRDSMTCVKRGGKGRSSITAPLKSQSEQEDFITTLHPEGSLNNIQHDIEKRRKLTRPDINFRIVAINLFIAIFVFIALCWWSVLYAFIFLCLYFMVRLRGILIFLILVYQRYAPENMRVACVFVPSCSEYMRLALIKYGVIRGIKKGLNRLSRCQHQNSGEDYP